ncbi:hypothetical protein [Rossellomorea aquimaris]|uniref:hypothetical protein n=1 Tax=Rossellomorea aquimaris TaxID=189382 RepID=UPI00249416E8|nr:hypothetical protein [Rossellomorea aquimaris]
MVVLINHLGRYKYPYMMSLILLLLFIYAIGRFKVFSLGSLTCITLIIILLVHLIIQFLIDKGLQTSNVHLIIWLGLISTFIGFTLSTYYTEIQKEESDKERLVGLLNITEGLANKRMNSARDSLRFKLMEYKNNEVDGNFKINANLLEIDIPANSVFPTIQENGEFVTYLSEDFVMKILFGSKETLAKGIDPNDYQQTVEKIKHYHLFIIQNKFLIERIELEKKFVNGELNKAEFNDKRYKLEQRWGDLQLYIVSDAKMEDYLELEDLGTNYENVFFWDEKPSSREGHVDPITFPEVVNLLNQKAE